jgi:RHS repeat-associated protein
MNAMYKIILHKKAISLLGCNTTLKRLLGLLVVVSALQSVSAQGIIMLEQQTPPTEVIVIATEQVILKPGFHAVGTAGSFNAKIGSANSMSPIIPMAAGSTAVITTIPIVPAAPSPDQNYIVSTTANKEVTDPTALNDGNSNTTIQYFDGLGRPIETVQKAITPGGKDLINLTQYDDFGREYQHWLPAPASGSAGAYVDATGFTNLSTTQYGSNAFAYNETKYEASPLNRVLGQQGAGADWQGHASSVAYQSNILDEVALYSVTGDDKLNKNNSYAASTLYKTETKDEDGNATYEFKDKQGQVILKQSMNGAEKVNTYYVYDDFGRLRYVLPPTAADGLTANGTFENNNDYLLKYSYLYQYDERGNNIYKRLPGCMPIHMAYDKANRLVLSQDGNQRKRLQGASMQWTVTKYDVLGRVVFTGLMYRSETDSTSSYQSIRSVVSDLVVPENYADFASATPLTVNYYDNYNFLPALPASKNAIGYQIKDGYTKAYPETATAASDLNPKGMLTGSRTYYLNGSGDYTATALYYDDRGRVVQSHSSNHLGGYDITYNALDFTGKPTKTYKTHGINGASDTNTELYGYTYDKAQRLLATTHQLKNGSLTTLAANTYDELGRVTTKTLGGVDATTYSYNIRNWTTGISGSRFTENLYYNANTANLPVFTPCYNGNIAAMQWSVPAEGLGYNRAYTFGYDPLNRLTDANYCGFNGSVVGGTSGRYNEHFGFDKMGNFNSLTRYENGSLLNSLSFIYTGNQLKKVDNAVSPYIPYGSEAFNDKQKIDTEYAYDKNGSTTADVNSGISTIQYNLLNLPDQIQFTEGHKNLYTYDAAGKKLEAINYTVNNIINVPIGTISTLPASSSDYTKLTTDYVGNMIYENGALKEILLPEGYYQGGVYYYYLKDHLGDNRVVINSSGTVIEKSHYYPSGMRFYPESNSNSAALPYRYNGKELEAMNGLNQYDYGARRRGAGLPMWTGVDPLAEMYYSVSPYAYCKNDPVNYIDPNGEFSKKWKAAIHRFFHGGGSKIEKNSNGQYYYTKGISGGAAVVYGSNGVKGKPDQVYGQTITGGSGSGSESTAQIHGPSIDASLFSFSFGGTNNATKGQFAYELASKIAALATSNVSNTNQDVNNPNSNSTSENDELELYDITYNTVLGDNESGKDIGGYQRNRGDTTHKVLRYFNKKTNKFIRKSEIYKPYRYRK